MLAKQNPKTKLTELQQKRELLDHQIDKLKLKISPANIVPIPKIFIGRSRLNLEESESDRWVIEPMLKIHLVKHFNIITEFRYNGYEDANSKLKGSGIAVRVELSY